tara:strand:- start:24 stop:719 length:696 start_codon:yes stop_codon:yes gene_type:complete
MATIFYDKIINDSFEMRKVYLNLFNKDSKVIAYGAPKVTNSHNKKLLNQFGIIKNEYYLIVGRLIPDNNADLIINGFLKSNSKKKLVIVGDVTYNDLYAKKIKNIDNTRLVKLGYVKDLNFLYQLYQNSFAYIHAHEFGGTNPTMIKALAYGCAILALETPFNREMLQNDKFGFFFQKNIISVKKLIDFSDNNSKIILKMKNNSHKGISNRYNWEHITNEYLDELKSLTKA